MTQLRLFRHPGDLEIGPTCESLLEFLRGPALLELEGEDTSRSRALSVLLHGNEPSGLRALHAWLLKAKRPAVNTLCFIGAVEAAWDPPFFRQRMKPGRRDLNRCFHPPYEGTDGALAEAVLQRLEKARPEALVDLHNNTGRNPAYGLGPDSSDAALALTALFAPCFVHAPLGLGTLVESLGPKTPSVTIECGKAGDPEADRTALAGLTAFLEMPRLPRSPASVCSLLSNPIRLHVRPDCRLHFATSLHPESDLTLCADLDASNFQYVRKGDLLGWSRAEAAWPFEALAPEGREISRDYLEIVGNRLLARADFLPIMITTDPHAVKIDCLCYLVRSISERRPPKG